MPTVGKGTKHERHFPYDKKGIISAMRYAQSRGLDIDMASSYGRPKEKEAQVIKSLTRPKTLKTLKTLVSKPPTTLQISGPTTSRLLSSGLRTSPISTFGRLAKPSTSENFVQRILKSPAFKTRFASKATPAQMKVIRGTILPRMRRNAARAARKREREALTTGAETTTKAPIKQQFVEKKPAPKKPETTQTWAERTTGSPTRQMFDTLSARQNKARRRKKQPVAATEGRTRSAQIAWELLQKLMGRRVA